MPSRGYSKTPVRDRPVFDTAVSSDQSPRSAVKTTKIHFRFITKGVTRSNSTTPKRTRMRDPILSPFPFQDFTPTRPRSRHRSPSVSSSRVNRQEADKSLSSAAYVPDAYFSHPASESPTSGEESNEAETNFDEITEEQLIEKMLEDPSLYKDIKELIKAKEKRMNVDQKKTSLRISRPPLPPCRK